MTTGSIRAGGRISNVTSRIANTAGAVAAGTAVIQSNSLTVVGNNSARGTNWIPSVRQPLGYASVQMPDGSTQSVPVMIDTNWYLFQDEMSQRRLGGVNGPVITDVVTNSTAATEAVTALTQQVSVVSQQSSAVATSFEVTKSVLVNANVPGADQIPNVSSNDQGVQD